MRGALIAHNVPLGMWSLLSGVMRSFALCLLCAPVFGSVSGIVGESHLGYCSGGERGQSAYYWNAIPVGKTAQLLTLFCRGCSGRPDTPEDLPVVSLLRDTLGDNSPENDRITYVWLLAATPRSWEQRLLSGIPFFYWRVSDGSTKVKSGDLSPLMDLNTP